jgi:hypothetical protein
MQVNGGEQGAALGCDTIQASRRPWACRIDGDSLQQTSSAKQQLAAKYVLFIDHVSDRGQRAWIG